jgi:hypothetical protein
LLLLLKQLLAIKGFTQHGVREFHNCIEVVFICRLLIEKAFLWGLPWVPVEVDVEKAFGSLKHSTLYESLEESEVPVSLRYAIFKEVAGAKYVRFRCNKTRTEYKKLSKGLTQGAHQSSFLFSRVVNWILARFDQKRK